MHSPSCIDSVDQLKIKGNESYKSRDFLSAIGLYSSAIAIASSSSSAVRGLEVLLSNRSAAHFELGDYASCTSDIFLACKMMSPEDRRLPSPLYVKIIKRLVQAQVLSLTPDRFDFPEDLVTLPEEMKNLVSSLMERLDDTRVAAAAGGSIPSSDIDATIKTLLRAGREWNELYPIGHDMARSLIGNKIESKNSDLEEDGRPNTCIPLEAVCSLSRPFSIFLAGVGDARHMLITLVDLKDRMDRAAKQHQSAPGTPDCKAMAKPRMHFLLNDLNATAIARLALLFVGMKRLSSFSDIKDRSNPLLTLELYSITTTYLGISLDNTVHAQLLEVMKMASESPTWLLDQLPFLRFSNESTLLAVQQIFRQWRSRMPSLTLTDLLAMFNTAQFNLSKTDEIDVEAMKQKRKEAEIEAVRGHVEAMPEESVRAFLAKLSATANVAGSADLSRLREKMVGIVTENLRILTSKPLTKTSLFLLQQISISLRRQSSCFLHQISRACQPASRSWSTSSDPRRKTKMAS